jgi:hypothetical protein
MTAALEGGEWSAARPGRTLPPGNIQYPFYRRLGGPQGQSGQAENLVPTRIQEHDVPNINIKPKLIVFADNTSIIVTNPNAID